MRSCAFSAVVLGIMVKREKSGLSPWISSCSRIVFMSPAIELLESKSLSSIVETRYICKKLERYFMVLMVCCSILMSAVEKGSSKSFVSRYLKPPLMIIPPVMMRRIPILFLNRQSGFAYPFSLFIASLQKKIMIKRILQNPKT